LSERAKELMNEMIDPSRPLEIEANQLKTIEDVQYVAQLIKNNPGERKATVMGKEVLVSEEAVEQLRTFLQK
jgi:hypothetical protein